MPLALFDLGFITDWLRLLLCALMQIPYFIIWAITGAINALVVALAAIAEGLVAVLPDMPADVELPSALEDVLGWIAWVFPVGTVVAILAFFFAAWLIWQGVAIALRWAKATGA